ncbi:hypothetical protein D3C85_813220 [compost metagenome]
MGTRGWRLQRAPVRREAPAHHRRDQRHRPGHPGIPAAPVRPRPAQRRRAARRGLWQGHPRAAGRRDHPRRQRQPDRPAAGQTQRDDPLRDPGQGAQAAVRLPAQFHPPLHARTQPPGRDRRDRRRRRLPELPGRLRGDPEAGRRRPDDRAPGLQPVHPEAQGGEGRLPQLDVQREVQAGQRLFPPQRRRRDAGVLGCRFRGLPPAAAGHAGGDGGRAGGSGAHPRAEPLALAPARHLRRDHLSRAGRVREGRPGGAAGRPQLVLRPRRNHLRQVHRPDRRARRRHRGAAPHGLPGRVLRRALRRRGGRGDPAGRPHAGEGREGLGRHRRHPRGLLQPLGVAGVDGHRQNRRRPAPVSAAQLPGPRNGAAHVDRECRLVLQRGRQARPDPGRAVRRPDRAEQGLLRRRRGRDQLPDRGPDGGGRARGVRRRRLRAAG